MSPVRTRTNDPQAMRGRILDAAGDLFQAQGYGSTTTQQIAAAAGVTAGAMHHHFPTKKALGLAVIRERVTAEVETAWLAPVREAASARAGIQAVFSTVQAWLDARGRVMGCPVSNLSLELAYADPDFREELRRIFDLWRRTLADRMRQDVAAGLESEPDPEGFATFVISAYSGAMAIAKADQKSDALRRTADRLAAWPR
ncbi:TetR/AcrR family transcriptional regulator [Niveispirillum sp. KHB5.9]|uniref:TetR/AcrR family transcriptional regulator n=1 Tax=Niveispirillum sp. KHB5.9 TaxID=3400269 RepID=UPI003A8BC47F